MKYQKDDTYREAAYASRRRHKKLLPSAPGDSKNLVQKHHKGLTPLLHFTDKRQRVYMSHFAYACKMRYPLNLVLENIEYLSFYWTFCIVILDYGLKLHKLSNHTLVMLQKWLEIH